MKTPEADVAAPTATYGGEPSGRTPGVFRWLPLIILGGALGTATRAALEQSFAPQPDALPWITLAINIVGSFLLGLLLETLSAAGPDHGSRRAARLTLGTGMLGGFTTYSTFMIETADRLRDGAVVVASGYLLGSILVGLGAAFAGLATASRLRVGHPTGEKT